MRFKLNLGKLKLLRGIELFREVEAFRKEIEASKNLGSLGK